MRKLLVTACDDLDAPTHYCRAANWCLAMSIAAVLLFGSLARADNVEASDTDLLMICNEPTIRHASVGHLSMFFYPWSQLVTDAHDGNLFVCHLVQESKPIFDPEDYLPKLRESFELRQNYDREISQAADLGWFLLKHGEELNSALLAKRIIWCVRTILIARSAEAKEPVFSPAALVGRSKSEIVRELLSERHNKYVSLMMRRSFHRFLAGDASFDPFYERADRMEFIERFKSAQNEVALKTLAQEEESQSSYG